MSVSRIRLIAKKVGQFSSAGLILALLAPTDLAAADYFVDYDAGADANSGTSREAAWKHAPGDSNAGGNPASVTLQPGDRVIFKGGVKYRGSILFSDSGTADKHIVYSGSEWGDEPAIVSGASVETISLKKCETAAQCGDSTKWQELVYATVPRAFHPFAPLLIDGARYWPSRSVQQEDFFWYDSLESYHELDASDAARTFTDKVMRVPTGFQSASDMAWGEPFVSVWIRANKVLLSRVTSIHPSENRLEHEFSLKDKLYPKRATLFSFFNRPVDIDQPGEFAIIPGRGLLLFYPYKNSTATSAKLEVSGPGNAFENPEANHLTIDGFRIVNFFGDEKDLRSGLAFQQRTSKTTKRDIRIVNNIVQDMASLKGNGAIDIASAENFWIEGNTIRNNLKSSGIRTYKTVGAYIGNNSISRIGRTGIRIIDSEDIVVDRNRISEIRGVHGNAMSYYIKNKDVLVINNYVEDTQNALTFHGDHDPEHVTNLQVVNNVLLGLTAGWGKAMRGALFAHNVMIDPSNDAKGFLLNDANRDMTVVNNIIGAWAARGFADDWTRSGNLYLSLSRIQSNKYGWKLAKDEKRAGGLTSIFKTAKAPDFRTVEKHTVDPIGPYLSTGYSFAPDLTYWDTAHPVGPTEDVLSME